MFETSVDKTWNYLAASILHTDTVPQFLQGLYHSFIYPSSMRWSARPTVSCALKTTRNELPDRFFSKKPSKFTPHPKYFKQRENWSQFRQKYWRWHLRKQSVFISFIIYSVQSRAHSTTHSRCHVEIYALFVLVLIINLQEFSLHSDLHLKISPFTKSTFHRLLFYKSKPIHHDNLQLTRGLLYTVQLFVCEFSSKV